MKAVSARLLHLRKNPLEYASLPEADEVSPQRSTMHVFLKGAFVANLKLFLA